MGCVLCFLTLDLNKKTINTLNACLKAKEQNFLNESYYFIKTKGAKIINKMYNIKKNRFSILHESCMRKIDDIFYLFLKKTNLRYMEA